MLETWHSCKVVFTGAPGVHSEITSAIDEEELWLWRFLTMQATAQVEVNDEKGLWLACQSTQATARVDVPAAPRQCFGFFFIE